MSTDASQAEPRKPQDRAKWTLTPDAELAALKAMLTLPQHIAIKLRTRLRRAVCASSNAEEAADKAAAAVRQARKQERKESGEYDKERALKRARREAGQAKAARFLDAEAGEGESDDPSGSEGEADDSGEA